ncbi:hypothetical protein ACFXKW_09760 [Streptomyces sp. NPDC059193]|uniref:hypothetical protein n=1 Tax=Streptomyces sp. NPDC059193 TaxID=3346763 RepID=UPI00369D3E8E
MSTVDLWSAKAKLRRAIGQCEDLNTRIEGFRANPNSRAVLRADLEAVSGYHILRINEIPDYRRTIEDVSLGVGDIVNNLRCSLDHLAWQYACAHAHGTPRRPRDVSFITCNASGGQQHKTPGFLPPKVWGRMHEYQPCRGRNGRPDGWSGPYIHQLDLLTALSNSDKHHMLAHIELHANQFSTITTRGDLPPWIARTESGVKLIPERVNDPDPGADHPDLSHASSLVEVGAEVARIRAPLWSGQPAIERVGTATPLFALPAGRPVGPTLRRLSEFVHMVICDLEQNCP